MIDKEIENLINKEAKRQVEGVELIASENYVSKDVLECMGSILTNKYSEGYPGKRYYGGNTYIDEIEQLAIDRAKELFHADHVNVQPYSGSPANLAVHVALLQTGDTTMSMSLSAGGHLSHGFKASVSGKYYNNITYGVDDNGYIDYDEVRRLANEYKPKLIWAGFSAYSRIIDWKEFRKIADGVGAYLVADISHVAGLVASGCYPSPVGIADVVTTTTHKTLRGPRGALIMCSDSLAKEIDKAVFPGIQGGPHNHIIAGIAVALKEASTEEFKEYSKQIIKNAQTLAEALQSRGYKIISGGTDNHMFLVNIVDSVGLTGEEASVTLESVNITINKNTIPNDTRNTWDPSGIRIGVPAITTRGMKEKEMLQISSFVDEALRNHKDKNKLMNIKREVVDFSKKYPIPSISLY
ncbi:serine hydroxymethyltransferase [bacterium]|nr:serine hydroxymethyltransferase [bacterium]